MADMDLRSEHVVKLGLSVVVLFLSDSKPWKEMKIQGYGVRHLPVK